MHTIYGLQSAFDTPSYLILANILKIVVVELLSCIQIFCDPMDCSLPDSSVHEISQEGILDVCSVTNTGVGCHFLSRDHLDPEIEPTSPAVQVDSLPLSHQGSPFLLG